MSSGYIYILRSPIFGGFTIKVGKTTKQPEIRAGELYSGATGVPVPFQVYISISVADCSLAEKRAHELLSSYRINPRREFFKIPPDVAADFIFDICKTINKDLAFTEPEIWKFDPDEERSSIDNESAQSKHLDRIYSIAPENLRSSPVGTSALSKAQQLRVKIVSMIFGAILPEEEMKWAENFSRDSNPEKELRIWEHMAKAFMSVSELEFASESVKTEAFYLLLVRSWASSDEAFETIKRKHLSSKAAISLLKQYKLPPTPLTISRKPRLIPALHFSLI